jgi:uncharacterized protein
MMTTKSEIDEFKAQQVIAVVGASNNPRKFGHIVLEELKSRNYQALAVNPNAQQVNGQPAYPNLKALPVQPTGVVFVVHPEQTALVARDVVELGIPWVWMQPGAESQQAIDLCTEKGIHVIHGDCILMHMDNGALYHRLHRFVKKTFGKLYTDS